MLIDARYHGNEIYVIYCLHTTHSFMHTILFTDTANEMQAWMTAIDASIQGSAGKAKERVKKVQLKFEHKKVGIPTVQSLPHTHTPILSCLVLLHVLYKTLSVIVLL